MRCLICLWKYFNGWDDDWIDKGVNCSWTCECANLIIAVPKCDEKIVLNMNVVEERINSVMNVSK